MTPAELVTVMMILSGGKHEGRAARIAPALAHAAEIYGVPAIELAAIAWHESAYRALARGRKGELGALQVAPSSRALWCLGVPVEERPSALINCGARLFARARIKCPAHQFTSYHTPSHCGPSQYEANIRKTLKKAGL